MIRDGDYRLLAITKPKNAPIITGQRAHPAMLELLLRTVGTLLLFTTGCAQLSPVPRQNVSGTRCALPLQSQPLTWEGNGIYSVVVTRQYSDVAVTRPRGSGRIYWSNGLALDIIWNQQDCSIAHTYAPRRLQFGLVGPGADPNGHYTVQNNRSPLSQRFSGLTFSSATWDVGGQYFVVGTDSLGRRVRSLPFTLQTTNVPIDVVP